MIQNKNILLTVLFLISVFGKDMETNLCTAAAQRQNTPLHDQSRDHMGLILEENLSRATVCFVDRRSGTTTDLARLL